MSDTTLANATIVINNAAIFYVPNSPKFNEGKGEQDVLIQSAGAGVVEAVFSENVETNIGMVAFSVRNTPKNIGLALGWKNLKRANAITISGDGGFTRSFSNMVLTNNYDVNLGADTPIDLEFKGDPAS